MSNLIKHKFLLVDGDRGGIGFSNYYEETYYKENALVTALYQLKQLDNHIVHCDLERNVEVMGIISYVKEHINKVGLRCETIYFQKNNARIACSKRFMGSPTSII